MKNFIYSLIITTCSLSAHAAITSTNMTGQCLYNGEDPNCLVSTTTSLPTLVFQAQEIELSSNEASSRILAEASGDIEMILIPMIASSLNVTESEVIEQVLELQASGKNVSVKLLVESISIR